MGPQPPLRCFTQDEASPGWLWSLLCCIPFPSLIFIESDICQSLSVLTAGCAIPYMSVIRLPRLLLRKPRLSPCMASLCRRCT